ncbi:MAG: TraB/GumN family protein, partial [Defluviitaleaceae bacterium]|nr:TraB/GumN family protein [Defluviitaleaceae bacterium]
MHNLRRLILLLHLAAILFLFATCGRDNFTGCSYEYTNNDYLSLVEIEPMPTLTPTQTTAPSPQPSQTSNDEIPLLWLVTAPHGQTMYMFGATHHGTADFYPLPDELMDAFRRSDYLAMETPLDVTIRDWDIPIVLEDYMSEEQRQELRHQAMAIFGEYESYLLEMMGITLDDLYDLDLAALSGIMSRMAGIKS